MHRKLHMGLRVKLLKVVVLLLGAAMDKETGEEMKKEKHGALRKGGFALMTIIVVALSVGLPIIASSYYISRENNATSNLDVIYSLLVPDTGKANKLTFPEREKIVNTLLDIEKERIKINAEEAKFSRTDVISIVLTSVSVMLTVITISLAIFGILGYSNFRELVSSAVVNYNDKNLPSLVKFYVDEKSDTVQKDRGDDAANSIAHSAR